MASQAMIDRKIEWQLRENCSLRNPDVQMTAQAVS
jgi:hypothetical protein